MKKSVSVIGMVAGVAIIVLGIVLATGSSSIDFNGVYAESLKFGGDFYTEQHSATAKAVNNINNLGKSLEEALHFAFIVGGMITSAIGLAITCYFNGWYIEAKNPSSPIVITQKDEPVSSELPEI